MSTLERRLTVGAVLVPFLAFVAAVVLLWGGLVSGRDLAIFAVMYLAVGFGVTVGFHRLLTHRSFEAPAAVRGTLAALGSMSLQGAVIHWVADHRKHHTFTDEDGDPHSPHLHGSEGWRGALKGLWHSHTGWLFDRSKRTEVRRFAPDLLKDPAIRFVDRWFLGWVAARPRAAVRRGPRPVGWRAGRRAQRAPVGRLRAHLPAPPRHLERELDLPHVRKPPVRDRGREPQQRGRRARDAGGGLAPQPPRLPDLGAAWPAQAAVRSHRTRSSGRWSSPASRATCASRVSARSRGSCPRSVSSCP